jgi:hypothetical protein
MGSKSVPTTPTIKAPTSAIVMTDEQYAVSQLRILRKIAEKSGKEIAKELRMWQDSLGHGKFKKNYLLAGWSQNSVEHYLSYYPKDDPAGNPLKDIVENKEAPAKEQETTSGTAPQVTDYKEPQSSIVWFTHKLENIIDTLDQILTEEKWRKDENFPKLQQVGAKLATLLGKL